MTPALATSDLNASTQNGVKNTPSSSLETASTRLAAEAQMTMQQRPAPKLASRGTQDVTANFIAASKQLQPGELVKDEYFTLFEAVGALEIMDPKMDSGYLEPDDPFEPEYQVDLEEPSDAQTLWIMDELMRLEMLFHEGYPLSQNIFTSLHVFRLIDPNNAYPYTIASPMRKLSRTQSILRVYCLALIKCCQLVLECIQAQTFYEEEDFVTYLFGRELCPNITAQDVLQQLSETISELNYSNTHLGDAEEALNTALCQRLEMRRSLLRALERHEGVEQTSLHWVQLRDQLSLVSSNRELARSLPAAFSDKVQRQLASSTPPRPMPEISWQEAQQKWARLCDDVLAAHDLTSIEVVRSPHQLKSAVWSFAYRSPAPTTYARGKLQELLTSDDKISGAVSHFDLMLADIRELVLPQDPLAEPESFLIEATHDIRHRISRVIEDFMIKAFGEYLNIYRMICQNRERMRRLFTQAIPIFDELESLALEADDQVMQIAPPRFTTDRRTEVYYPLWTWTRLHKLYLVQWTVQLGFETSLYQDTSIAQMYDVLNSIFAQEDRFTCTIISSIRARKKATSTRKEAADTERSLTWLYSLQQGCYICQNLALVLTTLWEFLGELGALPAVHNRLYYQDERQYEARMKPFLSMQYQVVPSLEDLKSGRASRKLQLYSAARLQQHLELVMGFSKGTSPEDTILNGLKQLQAALPKSDHVRQQEFKKLEATCWAIKIALTQLVSICKKLGKEHNESGQYSLRNIARVEIPEAKDRKHPWWVIPKIIEIAR